MDIECEGWTTILEVFPDMDFTAELEEKPELAKYMRAAINSKSVGIDDPQTLKDAPKLDDDFSKFILLNGLPKVDEKKGEKLKALLIKLFSKKGNFTLTEDKLDLKFDDAEPKMGTGQCFVQMNTDEQAKIAAAQFNGHAIDKKHTISSCTVPDFEKIMMGNGLPTEEESKREITYLDLKEHCLETKDTEYAYQQGKNVVVNALQGQQRPLFNLEDEERAPKLEPYQTDKPFTWSPKGSFMIVIKSDKVEFINGHQQFPILTIMETKVDSVLFSPCEKYLLVYQPKSDLPYSIWNFMANEKIREFEQYSGENAHTFKWSFDGKFIAKMSVKTLKAAEGEEAPEEEEEPQNNQISVYEMPGGKLCQDLDGNRTSIQADGITEFLWFPNKNWLCFVSFPSNTNVHPRVTFLEFPTRRMMHTHTIKDSTEMKLYLHPQGSYLGVMNSYLYRKTQKYSVELFDLQEYKGSIPHIQVIVEKKVEEFYGIIWEPYHAKMAIHTKSEKILEAGQKQFSNDPFRTTVDVYQLKSDKLLGFVIKGCGTIPGEKIVEFQFSAAGNLFSCVEAEATTRQTLNFYLIRKVSNEGQTTSAIQQGKKRTDPLITDKHLAAVDDSYEFIKTQRHEVKEKKWYSKWDENGRFFMIQGRKVLTDKHPRSIIFFNMFGELIEQYPEIYQLDQVHFRPRPNDILKQDKIKALKKNGTYKKLYEQMYKDEEQLEKKVQNDVVKDQRKQIREDFLNNFFIPLRRDYESKINKFKAIFPIKDSDIAEEEATINTVYQYGDVISQRKLEIQ